MSASTAIAKKITFTKNLTTLSALIAAYAAQASIVKLRIRGSENRLDFYTKNVSTYCRRALAQFGFDIKTFGYQPELMREKTFLMISNHLSYLDIMVLASIQPWVFVTSVDMGETPFLGQMAEMGGSLFIERRNRNHIGRDVGVMADTLRAGHNVVIYPEGTSGDGVGVMPFKRSLLASAIEAGVDAMPIVIKYTEINGEPFSIANRDKICWYGDMAFAPHFVGLLGITSVKVELHFLEPIKVTKTTDRHELADQAHKAISDVYGHPFA